MQLQRPVLPTGTLTFLFTDIEGSTARWEQNADEMRATLARHDTAVREALERRGGTIFKTVGDAFCSVFADPAEAVAAAADIERTVEGVRVRVALHTGTAQVRDEDYFGPTLNRVARLLAHAQGGQVILTQATERLVHDQLPEQFGLTDLGERELKDLARPVRVFQLTFPGMLPVFGSLSTRSFNPNNLPEELSSFVGRKMELQRLRKLLLQKREVTVVGPGGVGKTRLALHLASEVLDAYPGGVWFVELAGVVAGEVGAAVAAAMDITVFGRDPVQSILNFFGVRGALLVLDNAEHILEPVGSFARELLRRGPHARVLVTSRERLRIEGEQTFLLQPLALPEEEVPLDILRRVDAVKLFVERGEAVRDDFKLTERNRADVVAVCERLDGIPLALELAAARLRSLSPAQVVARLDEQFALLTGGSERLDHHRTLRATIDWSYRLLDDRERLLLARLAILQGPFTLEAVEGVCDDARIGRYEIFDVLAALVEKSFLTHVDSPQTPQFRMLHTIRAYASERLAETGEYATLAARHYAYHRDLVARANEMRRHDQNAGFDLIENARVDIRAALDWAYRDENAEIVAVALDLVKFWIVRGYLSEGSGELERIARAAWIDPAQRSELLVRASGLRNAIGDHELARRDAEEAVELCEGTPGYCGLADALTALAGVFSNAGGHERALEIYLRALPLHEANGDFHGLLQTLTNVGIVQTSLGRFEDARASLARALPIAAAHGETRDLAWLHGALGNVAHQAGNLPEARRCYEECLTLCRSIGFKTGMATVLNHLAEVALLEGDDDGARRFASESLALAWEHNLALQLTDAIEVCARIAAARAEDVTAAQFFGAVDKLRARLDFPFAPAEQQAREDAMRPVRARNGDLWFAARCAEGAGQTLPSIVRLAQTLLKPRSAAAPRK